jgi:hypothetical protein
VTAALPELPHLQAQLEIPSATLLDLTRRMAETMRLIDLAPEEAREADGYPEAGCTTAPCDACGRPRGREWPECPAARGEVLCPSCFRALHEPTICECGAEKPAAAGLCDRCATDNE